MEKNKVIFLDRDGTINVDYGYVYETSKLTFIDGALEGLKKLYDNGYKLIIITNQSGIGRGYYSSEQYDYFTNYMLKKLDGKGINISKIYTCPHIDADNCECRKPKLKLFYDAISEFNVDERNSYAIGDKMRDLSICEETLVKGILLSNDAVSNKKIVIAENLNDAADYILSHNE